MDVSAVGNALKVVDAFTPEVIEFMEEAGTENPEEI